MSACGTSPGYPLFEPGGLFDALRPLHAVPSLETRLYPPTERRGCAPHHQPANQRVRVMKGLTTGPSSYEEYQSRSSLTCSSSHSRASSSMPPLESISGESPRVDPRTDCGVASQLRAPGSSAGVNPPSPTSRTTAHATTSLITSTTRSLVPSSVGYSHASSIHVSVCTTSSWCRCLLPASACSISIVSTPAE
jgi:hypothetical protein